MFTIETDEGHIVGLAAAHVESIMTMPGSPELTLITMASGAQFTARAGSKEIAMRMANVLRP